MCNHESPLPRRGRRKFERTLPRWSSGTWLLAVLACLWPTAARTTHAQIILDGPNVSGTIGLTGETFGSAYVSVYWNGGNLQTQLVNGDTDFSVRVEPDKVLSVSDYMYSFQGATNANVYQWVGNITGPTAAATTPLPLNLARSAGRIVGRVAVTGGSVSRVTINASKSLSANESVWGDATTTATPFDAVLPFVAVNGVSLSGTAVLRADTGCDVPVTLGSRSVDVAAGQSVVAAWSFDLTNEQCSQGAIQGQVTFNGLGGQNADVVSAWGYVYLSGPVSRSTQTDASGHYSFTGLPPGNYYLYGYTYFNAPYSYFYYPAVSVTVAGGDLLTRNFSMDVATAHATIQPRGAWQLSDASDVLAGYSSTGAAGAHLGASYDWAQSGTGQLDLVLPAGSGQFDYWRAFFYRNDGVRYAYEYFYNYFYGASRPLGGTFSVGDRRDLGVYEPDTSESLVVVQPANQTVGLSQLRLVGSHAVLNAQNVQTEQRQIDLTSYAIGTPQNSVSVLVRGRPGTYRMNATGQGTDGATYSRQFDLVLGAPSNTGTGADVVTPIAIVDETSGATTTGSITFGDVTVAGDTTVSASGSGPQAPGNFRVFGVGSMLYYDIQTTAQFDAAAGATVCLGYDDTGLSPTRESRLTLQHYVCANSQTNTGCSWEDITLAGSPDISANTICGLTQSFSIFALMEPLDQDADGVADGQDNCPALWNPEQADADGDGLGDDCDSDDDSDGVDDTADNCFAVPNPGQADQDGDGIGDACDTDVDGDASVNDQDNCPLNANPGQVDFDGDGFGDACDPDDDSDGVQDGQDSCPGTAAGSLILNNGCSSLQDLQLACPANATYPNHGQYVQCVAHEANSQLAAGLITTQEKDAMVATAAKSRTGQQ